MQSQSNSFESVWQEYVPEIAWGTILMGLLVIVSYPIVLLSAIAGYIAYPAATLICALLTYLSFTVMHEAGHGGIVKSGNSFKAVEIAMGWIFSLPFLITPFRLFQKIHDRHHAFTNDPDRDPDSYLFKDGIAGIIVSSLFIPVQYHVHALTRLRNVKVIRDTYLSSAIYQLFTLGSLILLSSMGYGLEVLCFAILPAVLAIFVLTMLFDYVPHHPHTSRDRFHDTRIYPGKFLNLITLGQNYHLIHHMYPRLPWYRYRDVYQKIRPDLEKRQAPIESLFSDTGPGFMKSKNANALLQDGKSLNMVLEVSNIERLTEDAVSIEFALPEGQKLNFTAGQYITVSKWLEGKQITRCYSLCSAPLNNELKIGVRTTTKGVMSGYLNDVVKVGDKLTVAGPFGEFIYPSTAATNDSIKEIVLLAGGSGITPMLSIIEQALYGQSDVRIKLIYANRSADSVMFYERLRQLEREFSSRLQVYLVMERETTSSSRDVAASAVIGRIDNQLLQHIVPTLDKNFRESKKDSTAFYICGPEGMKEVALASLLKANIDESRIHIEQFISIAAEPIGKLHSVEVSLADGATHKFEVASNQSVLEVANSIDVQLPHACGTGTCGSCKLSVIGGKSEPIANVIPGITVEEKQGGITLACQCKPSSNMQLKEA